MQKFKHTPEEARKLWVDALLSGKYQQGTGQLCRNGKFCCLGVACELFRIWENPRFAYDPTEPQIPEVVREWLAMQTSTGHFKDHQKANSLTALNDNGNPFFALASVIEAEPPRLFVYGPQNCQEDTTP